MSCRRYFSIANWALLSWQLRNVSRCRLSIADRLAAREPPRRRPKAKFHLAKSVRTLSVAEQTLDSVRADHGSAQQNGSRSGQTFTMITIELLRPSWTRLAGQRAESVALNTNWTLMSQQFETSFPSFVLLTGDIKIGDQTKLGCLNIQIRLSLAPFYHRTLAAHIIMATIIMILQLRLPLHCYKAHANYFLSGPVPLILATSVGWPTRRARLVCFLIGNPRRPARELRATVCLLLHSRYALISIIQLLPASALIETRSGSWPAC